MNASGNEETLFAVSSCYGGRYVCSLVVQSGHGVKISVTGKETVMRTVRTTGNGRMARGESNDEKLHQTNEAVTSPTAYAVSKYFRRAEREVA